MCLNLFFPFLVWKPAGRAVMLEALDWGGETLAEGPIFERVPDPDEGTNLDVLLRAQSGRELAIEVKLSESEFGTAAADARHRQKREQVYLLRLQHRVVPEALEEGTFFRHYQLLRNVAFADPTIPREVLFLVPRANDRLQRGLAALNRFVLPQLRPFVRVLYLEDLLERLRKRRAELPAALVPVVEQFATKYCPPSLQTSSGH